MSIEQNVSTEQKIRKGIPGSTLKIIAIVTMLIDHIAAVVLDGYLVNIGFYNRMTNMFVLAPTETTMTKVIYVIDMVMRLIGRLGFPLFCFLLVEGFFYTKSRTRYAFRLFLFALISEIPFDLALGLTDNYLPEFSYQNVYFTLFLGLLTIWGLNQTKKWYTRLPILLLGLVVASVLRTDYGALGVATIVLMFVFRKKSNVASMLAGCITLTLGQLLEITSFADVYLVSKYNGERGLKLKYVFYFFYPVHLFILYLIKLLVLNGMG